MNAAGPALVVAGLSARTLAEAAQQGGWRVIALDAFGDRDTLHASERWASIADAGPLGIDGQALCSALAEAARTPGIEGWVAGSGFEARPELLERGGRELPLLGMEARAVRAVREPRHFFATLARLGLPHPETRFEPPPQPEGWLVKRAAGTGGWHIRDAATAGRLAADAYFQRLRNGVPMSALFLADGREARLVALNRLIVRRLGSHPFVYRGAIGPIVDGALQRRIAQALTQLVPAFDVRDLASLDFMLADDVPFLLEINPRPSASMALHPASLPGGLMRAHVRALDGVLPQAPEHAPGLRGAETLFARRRCRIDVSLADTLAGMTDCHDLPAAGAQFAHGDPVCTVSATGETAAGVEVALAARKTWIETRLLDIPETP